MTQTSRGSWMVPPMQSAARKRVAERQMHDYALASSVLQLQLADEVSKV
jgi:hypothetical protein